MMCKSLLMAGQVDAGLDCESVDNEVKVRSTKRTDLVMPPKLNLPQGR